MQATLLGNVHLFVARTERSGLVMCVVCNGYTVSGDSTQLSIICLTWSCMSVHSKSMHHFVFKIVVHTNLRGYSLVFVQIAIQKQC